MIRSYLRRLNWSRWALLVGLLLAGRLAPLDAQPPIGTISPTGERILITVAVPEFQFTGAGVQDFSFASVIQRDLSLSGYIKPPKNPLHAKETRQQELLQNTILYAEWVYIGVEYLALGTYQVDEKTNLIHAEMRLYETGSQKYVFGMEYKDFPKDQVRRLAHKISDDIFERLITLKGIASTEIAFVRSLDSHGKAKQVCIMDADGENIRTVSDGKALVATPCWGNNGTEIYYTSFADYNPDLQGVILKSKYKWWVSRRKGFNLSPSWNEAAKLIALTFTKDDNSEIYTITREGKNPQRLTVNQAIDSSPVWSPDGAQLAFTSDRTGSPQIYIMNANTLETRRLTYSGTYNDGAAWSPTGDRLAYMSRIDGDFQIMTINVDGSNNRQLTPAPTDDYSSNNEDPTWAPNGEVIAFTSDRVGAKQIYTMAKDGLNVNRLTSGQACVSPAWSPPAP